MNASRKEDPRPVLARLKDGDAETQRWFWATRRSTVERISQHILGAGIDAEEVADEVMIDFMFDCVHRLEHDGAIDGYLRLMVTRRALRRKERLKKEHAIGDDELEADGARPEDQVADKLLLPKLEECLRALTPKAREVLVLRYRSELTNEKIGELVGGSKQYIGRLLTRSLEVLRDCLDRRQKLSEAGDA